MGFQQMLMEYILVYCTSYGLTSLGEPPTTYQAVNETISQCSRIKSEPIYGCKPAMPVWIISMFLLLATSKWIISFFLWYLYLLLSTVTAIASAPVSPLAILNATGHYDSHYTRLHRLSLTLRVLGAFKPSHQAHQPAVLTTSVPETRLALTRRATNPSPLPSPLSKRHAPTTTTTTRSHTLWHRLHTHPAFRGLSAHLTLQIPQWYLSHIIDVFLSGLPSDHTPGYGSTGIVLATAFGGGAAVWTHYCITPPSRTKPILSHFPRGHQVLTELWPVTAFWAVCEHLCRSVPLALSRVFGLREWVGEAAGWNRLGGEAQRGVLVKFAGVWAVHLGFVVVVGLPAMMVARRFYASMLSEGDFAIVPFYRRGPRREERGDHTAGGRWRVEDERNLRKPGLTVSEAWGTVRWEQYLRVLAVYVGWVAVSQVVHFGYWWLNWELQRSLGVKRYEGSTRLPCSPIGLVEPVLFSNLTYGGLGLLGGRDLMTGFRSEL